MTAIVRAVAEEHCGGKLVMLLEGGYRLAALGACVAATIRAMSAAHPPSA